MLVDELEQALDVEFSERDEDTVGGVMLSELGGSPHDNVMLPPLTLRVVEVDENRIKRVRVTVDVPAASRA